MPEFVIFAIAASMCVLCFAVGFVAALVLRIAGQNALPSLGVPGASQASTPTERDTPQPGLMEATPGRAPHVHPVQSPHAVSVPEPPPAAPRSPAPLPLRPTAFADRSAGFPTPPAPAAKVFLFGDPPLEPAAVPSLAAVHTVSHPSPQAPQPHPPQQRPASSEIDLLPRRPQYARSARRR